jgi:hypothetical protein
MKLVISNYLQTVNIMSKHKPFLGDIIGGMKDDPRTPHKQSMFTNRALKTVMGILVVTGVTILLITQLVEPKRSVAEYCKVYKVEKARLAELPGDTWPSAVFDDTIGDAREFSFSFGRLERVSPDEIKSDMATLQGVYRKVHDDPASAIGISLSGASAEENAKSWTMAHCK